MKNTKYYYVRVYAADYKWEELYIHNPEKMTLVNHSEVNSPRVNTVEEAKDIIDNEIYNLPEEFQKSPVHADKKIYRISVESTFKYYSYTIYEVENGRERILPRERI